jgi:hypothetical protein
MEHGPAQSRCGLIGRTACSARSLGEEADVSYAFKKAGYRIAYLEVPAVTHIGDGRHIDDPNFPPRARTVIDRLAKSVRKRVKRLRRVVGK